jgi:hypothetical protein
LLLKAVLMPITTKAFWGGLATKAVLPPLLLARSTAISISRVDTALSSDLHKSKTVHGCTHMNHHYVA